MEAGVVRALLLCLALVVAPVAAASPDDGVPGALLDEPSSPSASSSPDDQGENQDDQGENQDDQGDEDGAEEVPEEDSIDLTVNPQDAGHRLDWAFHGKRDKVKSFEIYRSINEGAAQLIGSLSKQDESFVDGDLQQSGTYNYLVVANNADGSQTYSNQQFVGFIGGSPATCTWVSVSPFGKPPVLFNEECNPLNP